MVRFSEHQQRCFLFGETVTAGRGAHANAELGEKAAIESREEIARLQGHSFLSVTIPLTILQSRIAADDSLEGQTFLQLMIAADAIAAKTVRILAGHLPFVEIL